MRVIMSPVFPHKLDRVFLSQFENWFWGPWPIGFGFEKLNWCWDPILIGTVIFNFQKLNRNWNFKNPIGIESVHQKYHSIFKLKLN